MIQQIIELEWDMFQAVQHIEGRAVCQDNYPTFLVMRKAQFLQYNEATLTSYLEDLEQAKSKNRNLMYEKYAWMMEKTEPKIFHQIQNRLVQPGFAQLELIRDIDLLLIPMKLAFNRKYPHLADASRPVYSFQDEIDDISFETYLVSELRTYRYATLFELLKHYQNLEQTGVNIIEQTMLWTVQQSGFTSLEEANALNNPTE